MTGDDAAGRHRTAIQVRFGDTDALGHINNAAYAQYAELARLDFLKLIGKEVRSLILAHLAIDFRRQVDYQDPVHVDTVVERLGKSSIALRQEVYAAGALAAEIRSVVVVFDYAAARSMPISPAVRAALSPYVVDAAPSAPDD